MSGRKDLEIRRAQVREYMKGQPRIKVDEWRIEHRHRLFAALVDSIFRIEQGIGTEEDMFVVEKMTKYPSFFSEDPNYGPQGEIDFCAIRLCRALHEKACYEKLSDRTRTELKRFFTKENYRSIHASENHCLMFRVSRLLAAQFYKNEYMENYKLTAEECYRQDQEYVVAFLQYRAKYGWGEFDALGYTAEIIVILVTLYTYTDCDRLRTLCRMALDVIFLDMVNDSLEEYYGGSHGRSYPEAIIDRDVAPMTMAYRYYFGKKFDVGKNSFGSRVYFSDYKPSELVYDVVEKGVFPRESFERKHLHLMSAWFGETIRWEDINKCEKASIDKYTYVCKEYALGAINHQDEYPLEIKSSDRNYAHHQQHEWELTLPEGDVKIFTHHYSDVKNTYRVNNRWTGDHSCGCGSFYANKDTLVAMYDIRNRERSDIINAYIPLQAFNDYYLDGKYVFLSYQNLFISVYFDNGYTLNEDEKDEFFYSEFLSRGWQNAVALRVKNKKDYTDVSAFMREIKSMPVVFDRERLQVRFDTILLCKETNYENGIENAYPYKEVYKSPFLYSVWGSGIVELKSEKERVLYDFNKIEIIKKTDQ